MTGGRLGEVVATDTLVSWEHVGLYQATGSALIYDPETREKIGQDDVLDVTNVAAGTTINFFNGEVSTGGNFNTGDFPFKFQGQPPVAGIGISLPIFTGFQRDLQVSQARAQRKDLVEQVRAQELAIGATVNSRVIGVETAWRAMAVQDRSRAAARDQLKLAEERYRLGSGTVLEVSDALNAVTGADASYVNAVYDYHRAMVALFAVLGRRYNN